MIITIASGKGGTGKTTIAVNLAKTISDTSGKSASEVWLLDSDVEEPNAGLFLNLIISEKKTASRLLPVFDNEKCIGCGRCAEVCVYNAIAVAGGKAMFFKELCHACGSCTLNCPTGAIEDTPQSIGLLEKGKSGRLNFAQGTLEIGFSSPVPVIRDLKKWVIPQNVENGLFIIDASPGTSCAVVESLRGSEFALLVTEPTPFGLHDLALVTQLVREEFCLPCGVVINKSGQNDGIIGDFCHEKDIPILMRLPLSRRIAEIYSKGNLLIEEDPVYRTMFASLYSEITRAMESELRTA